VDLAKALEEPGDIRILEH
jgi:hypothetical protein